MLCRNKALLATVERNLASLASALEKGCEDYPLWAMTVTRRTHRRLTHQTLAISE